MMQGVPPQSGPDQQPDESDVDPAGSDPDFDDDAGEDALQAASQESSVQKIRAALAAAMEGAEAPAPIVGKIETGSHAQPPVVDQKPESGPGHAPGTDGIPNLLSGRARRSAPGPGRVPEPAPEPDAVPSSAPSSAEYDRAGFVEIHPELPKVNPNLVFGATMALWRPPRFTPHELLDMVNEILAGTGAVAQFDEKMQGVDRQPRFSVLKRRLRGPPSAMLRVNGLFTLVGGGDKAAFIGKALEDRVNPALWSEGIERLSKSRGHVMIADAHPGDPNDPDLNYDRAVAVTVTAAAVSLLTDPVGIIWHPAGNATPPDVIPDFIQSLAEGLAPLPLWLRWMLVPPVEGRNPGAASRGLEALLGMELEIAPNDFSLEKTVGDLFQIAAVHVRRGKAPPDGSQVGTKDKTWYHAKYHERGVVTGTPVFRLTPVSDYSGD